MRIGTHTKDSNVATSDETPATITTARARLEPVPPGDELATISTGCDAPLRNAVYQRVWQPLVGEIKTS